MGTFGEFSRHGLARNFANNGVARCWEVIHCKSRQKSLVSFSHLATFDFFLPKCKIRGVGRHSSILELIKTVDYLVNKNIKFLL